MYWYNWIKPHRTLSPKGKAPTTPAMAAGLADWRRRFEDIIALVDDDYEARRPKTRGPYRAQFKLNHYLRTVTENCGLAPGVSSL